MKGNAEPAANDTMKAEGLKKSRRRKIIQKLSWLFIFLIIIFTALGVYGTGPFGYYLQTNATQTIEYDHFLRCERETRFKFHLNEYKGYTTLAIPENYLQYFKINFIYPEPEQQSHESGNIVYVFDADRDQMVSFYVEPRKTGSIKGSVLIGDESFTLSHFIYPQ